MKNFCQKIQTVSSTTILVLTVISSLKTGCLQLKNDLIISHTAGRPGSFTVDPTSHHANRIGLPIGPPPPVPRVPSQNALQQSMMQQDNYMNMGGGGGNQPKQYGSKPSLVSAV